MVYGNIIRRFQRSRKEHGFYGAIWHFLRQKTPFHISLVYFVDAPVGSCHVENISIERFSQKDMVRPEILESLHRVRGEAIIHEIEKLFLRGSELWLGRFNGTIAGICWTTHGLDRNDYFVPLTQKDGTISSCFVFPELRGRGIYPFMLQTIVNRLLEKGQLRRIYIDCKSWNYPSIRGIQKAGFEPLGSAVRIILFGRTWILRRKFT